MRQKLHLSVTLILTLLLAHSSIAQIATKVHYVEKTTQFVQLGPHPVMEVDF